MAVGIEQEYLRGPVRAPFPSIKLSAGCFKMLFPLIQIVHAQSEMIVGMGLEKWRAEIRDQVQLLIGSQAKPCARKIKGRPRNRGESQYVLIKGAAALEVSDVEGDVVEFESGHNELTPTLPQLAKTVHARLDHNKCFRKLSLGISPQYALQFLVSGPKSGRADAEQNHSSTKVFDKY